MKLATLASCFLFVFAFGCGGDSSQPGALQAEPIAGVWRGTVEQKGWDPYSIELTLTGFNDGQTCGSVRYPSFGCSGTLTCLLQEESRFKLIEALESGSCKNGGVVWVEPSGEQGLAWDWSWNSGAETASAMLTRKP